MPLVASHIGVLRFRILGQPSHVERHLRRSTNRPDGPACRRPARPARWHLAVYSARYPFVAPSDLRPALAAGRGDAGRTRLRPAIAMPPPWSRRPAGLALRSADAGWCGLQRTGASAPAGALPIAIGCRCAAGPSSASGTPAIGGSFGGRRGFASALVRLVLQTLSADVGGLGGAYVRQARPMAAVAHAHHQARTIAWKIFDEMKVLHTVKAPTSLRKDAGEWARWAARAPRPPTPRGAHAALCSCASLTQNHLRRLAQAPTCPCR